MNVEHGIAIELHYLPMPYTSEKDILRFQAESFTRVGPLSEVALFKARNLTVGHLARLCCAIRSENPNYLKLSDSYTIQ